MRYDSYDTRLLFSCIFILYRYEVATFESTEEVHMDQVKVGEFISTERKAKKLTQKELAEQLGVSDKTISRWETGNGLPDMAYLTPLCDLLKVSVNELLSGEKLPPNEYSMKAEENIMALLQENQKNKKSDRIQFAIGIVLLIVAMFMLKISMNGINNCIENFLDFPSIIFVVLASVACVFISGKRGKKDVVALLRKIVIPIGAIISVVAVVVILTNVNNNMLGANLAVAILSFLYSVVAYLILVIIESRIKE